MKIPGLSDAVDDVRAIADGMRILPELARILTAIQERTDSMGEEVSRMREGVDELGVAVGAMTERVGNLEPHLDEMRRSLRPLERVVGRMRPGRRRQGNGEEEEAVEPDAA